MSSGFAAVAVLYETEPYCFLQLCLERKKYCHGFGRQDTRQKAGIQGVLHLKLWNYLSYLPKKHNYTYRYIN